MMMCPPAHVGMPEVRSGQVIIAYDRLRIRHAFVDFGVPIDRHAQNSVARKQSLRFEEIRFECRSPPIRQ
jgi:hypothetical protein